MDLYATLASKRPQGQFSGFGIDPVGAHVKYTSTGIAGARIRWFDLAAESRAKVLQELSGPILAVLVSKVSQLPRELKLRSIVAQVLPPVTITFWKYRGELLTTFYSIKRVCSTEHRDVLA